MEHFFLDQQTSLQSDAYRIGRRATRSSTREDEAALEEGIEALGAHLSFAEHQYRAIADALGDGPPVTLESFFEEPVAPGEYQLFVTSEIHDLLDTGALDSRSIEEHVTATVEVEASVSEPSSPAAHSVTSISSNSSTAAAAPTAPPAPSAAAAMFRAAAAAAVSPSSVVGPRSRRKAQPTVPQQQLQRSRSRQDTAGFDSYSVTSDGDDSFDAAFDEINIELTEVSTSNQRVTVITSVSPASPAASTPTNNKRRNTAGTPTNNKRGSSSTPTTPGKRGRRTNTTSFTLIETQTNYLEDKPKDRTGSFAGEEVLRISSVVIEEDVDILN